MIDIFERCKTISNLLNRGKEAEARNALIILLQELKDDNIGYTPLVNHLIRETGLYPYIDESTSDWQERFLLEAFKVDVGGNQKVTLHREQSNVLKALLNGEDLAISAPTSFGKSFIIDAFIAMKNPDNVVIIVPTIALADETRRRLYKKFSSTYKIITTTEIELGEMNILVFPQERALYYSDKLDNIDLLVVDEFYKAGSISGCDNKDERTPQLLNAIISLGEKSKQRYFLAPNISNLTSNPFTQGMRFEKVDFNAVHTAVHNLYSEDAGTAEARKLHKTEVLRTLITKGLEKSLIYGGTYSEVEYVSNFLASILSPLDSSLLKSFSMWLKENYGMQCQLADLVSKGIGIHTGYLHRSLSQVQVRLFEEEAGLLFVVSTSSIIEGVNTSAKNVILWSNKSGTKGIDYFTYGNIKGRSGRMFRHFVGDVFNLEKVPTESDSNLSIEVSNNLLDEFTSKYNSILTDEQIEWIRDCERQLDSILGVGEFRKVSDEAISLGISVRLLKKVINEMRKDLSRWKRTLPLLLSNNPKLWKKPLGMLYPILGGCGIEYRRLTYFIQVVSQSWNMTLPELLNQLAPVNIQLDKYFELERKISFKLASVVYCVQFVARKLISSSIDLTKFIGGLSNCFLPKAVFELEEYGLPRMISRKIHQSGIIDLRSTRPINDVISDFLLIGKGQLVSSVSLSEFDVYIVDYFFDGITSSSTP